MKCKPLSQRLQYSENAKKQKRYASYAFKEGRYAKKQEKKFKKLGKTIIAKDYREEGEICDFFGNFRTELANEYEKMARCN